MMNMLLSLTPKVLTSFLLKASISPITTEQADATELKDSSSQRDPSVSANEPENINVSSLPFVKSLDTMGSAALSNICKEVPLTNVQYESSFFFQDLSSPLIC